MAVAAFAGCAAVPVGERTQVAQRFEVSAHLASDGSLEVEEVIAFRFIGGEYSSVTRKLDARGSDGVDILDARLDGRPMPAGRQVGEVRVSRSRRRTEVVWQFEPTVDRVRVFSIRYRYAGVVAHGDGEDWVRWRPFPSDVDYRIESGSVRLTWPADARLRRPVDLDGPSAASSPEESGFTARVAAYEESAPPLALTVRFEPGAFPGAEPLWQRDLRRADGMAPAFMAAAAMILAATILAFIVFFLRYRRLDGEAPVPIRPESLPPDELPPALGGSITAGRLALGADQWLATVFDLARRGVVSVAEVDPTGAARRCFELRRRTTAGTLAPHETAILRELFPAEALSSPLVDGLRRVAARHRSIRRAASTELQAARLIDVDRADGARALRVSGFVVLVFAALLTVVSFLTDFRLGPASMWVPAAFAMSAVTMLAVGTRFSTLNRDGIRVARRWDAFRRILCEDLAAGRVPRTEGDLGQLLPYAAAFGLLASLRQALEKVPGVPLPPWLHAIQSGSDAAVLIALLGTSTRAASVREATLLQSRRL